jgi:hypothetical protein
LKKLKKFSNTNKKLKKYSRKLKTHQTYKPKTQKSMTKFERNPTEPVVASLRSDCCGAMAEQMVMV